MENPEFLPQTNGVEKAADRMIEGGIMDYGMSQIQVASPDCPQGLDFSTALAAETLTDEDLKELSPKKKDTREEENAP